MRLSVILNTLNEANRPLEQCLISILKNSPCELIIVDGGSNDNTLEICKKFTDKVFISEPGIAKQQLLALSHAQGQFVIVAESDMIFRKTI